MSSKPKYTCGIINSAEIPQVITWGVKGKECEARARALVMDLESGRTLLTAWRTMVPSEYAPKYFGCWGVWELPEPQFNELGEIAP